MESHGDLFDLSCHVSESHIDLVLDNGRILLAGRCDPLISIPVGHGPQVHQEYYLPLCVHVRLTPVHDRLWDALITVVSCTRFPSALQSTDHALCGLVDSALKPSQSFDGVGLLDRQHLQEGIAPGVAMAERDAEKACRGVRLGGTANHVLAFVRRTAADGCGEARAR